MTYDKLAFRSLLDVISKEQIRIACHISKCFLIEYLSTDNYNKTNRKTKEHLDAIWQVCKQSHVYGVSVGITKDEQA